MRGILKSLKNYCKFPSNFSKCNAKISTENMHKIWHFEKFDGNLQHDRFDKNDDTHSIIALSLFPSKPIINTIPW
jgi:hypothetical protein